MQTNSHPLLQEILSQLKSLNTCNKEFLSFSQACDYLDLSASFLYKMTSDRKLPFYVPNGKKIYFKKADLDSWITRKRLDTTEEIKNA
jgi:excisionase family DNA binding protein